MTTSTDQFCLSDLIIPCETKSSKGNGEYDNKSYWIKTEDVKEFLRRLKEALDYNSSEKRKIIEVGKAKAIIDKLAGDKLK